MSLCRWSSDDWRSDVYVYEAHTGWIIHVAGRRHVFTEPLPPPVDTSDFDAWLKRDQQVHRMVKAANLVDIDLPSAGRTFVTDSPGSCARVLRRLRTEGFHVPDGVIDALDEEQRHEDTSR